MGPLTINEISQKVDELINSHEIDKAKKLLQEINLRSLPEKSRGHFASLARRSGEWKLALRILQPNVFGAGRPNPDDIMEYASSVRRLGLLNQALILLDRVPDSAKKHLNKAFCFIHLWAYEDAQKELENYLKYQDLSIKEKLVGKINLLSCYIENQEFDRAQNLLNELEGECAEHSPHLLLNCQETRGQILIKTGKPFEAQKVLKEAQEKTKRQMHHTSLFIEKWLLVAEFFDGKLEQNSQRVKQFKQKVRNAGFWEVLRDFEWQEAKIFNDKELMRSVYFGTPYTGFRHIMEMEANPDIFHGSLIRSYRRPTSPEGGEIFDPYNFNQVPMAFGKAVHRLFMLLLSDQYSPFSVVRIFNSLFPEEIFDPVTSHKKVYRSLEQLKESLEKNELPLELCSTTKGYRLRALEKGAFYVHSKMIFAHREEFLSHILSIHGLNDRFRVKEARQVIPLSTHQWYRAFKSMQERGVLEQSPESQSFYRLKAG